MGNLIYAYATALMIIWAIAYYGYGAGGVTHILPFMAVIIVVVKITQRNRYFN
jgi:hypothetical protein